jgi:diaminopimelate epimerase
MSLELLTDDGKVDRVRVDLGEPILIADQIPTTLSASAEGAVVDAELSVAGKTVRVTCVSMGNPHCVVYVDKLSDDWVLGVGPQLEIDSHFPNRVNVEFVEVISPAEVRQRTWERGSGETLACGTGAAAVCVAGVLTGRTERKVLIHLSGGDLTLEWQEDTNRVIMTGPAVEVFSGEWEEK